MNPSQERPLRPGCPAAPAAKAKRKRGQLQYRIFTSPPPPPLLAPEEISSNRRLSAPRLAPRQPHGPARNLLPPPSPVEMPPPSSSHQHALPPRREPPATICDGRRGRQGTADIPRGQDDADADAGLGQLRPALPVLSSWINCRRPVWWCWASRASCPSSPKTAAVCRT